MHEVKIELKNPITVCGEVVTQLTMRAPKVRDILAGEKAFKNPGAEREIYVMALLCGVTPAIIEELDMSDYVRLQKASEDFLSSAPGTAGA